MAILTWTCNAFDDQAGIHKDDTAEQKCLKYAKSLQEEYFAIGTNWVFTVELDCGKKFTVDLEDETVLEIE